jgi:thiol-disulfide isomerase/thioredoxin
MKGKLAPALSGVLGWKGNEVKLADLKGQYVVLAFWGYWCTPCVGEMPALFKLHREFGRRGLAIIGIHVDPNEEVDTPAKLDQKIASARRSAWQGEDIPFPVALAAWSQDNASNGPVGQFGVKQFPTNILINREGKVVGSVNLSDVNAAREMFKALLTPDK